MEKRFGSVLIKGIGVDVCDIGRIKEGIKSDHFLKRAFADVEIEYAFSKARPEQHLAGCFAAKEALSKALAVGLWDLGLKNAWVLRGNEGEPKFGFSASLSEKLCRSGIDKVWLTISHEKEMAAAFVILEALI